MTIYKFAFDFGGKNCDEVTLQKELIKTNVLGLVFEKLNGYKEGSFYTPNFITSYMCRVSLEKVVLDKFNSANPKWNATNLSDLATLIRDERERKDDFKRILREIRICDPAVGSGHFLVSALCEMVRIYHFLRLSDELNEYELKIDNDEIIVYVENGRIFEYKKPTKPNDTNQSIQKSLFRLKKSIIENNLFGVDINPNSVEICKLRLWIELLKNSYYLRDSSEGFSANLSESIHQMQTLPNIDINIKCGNSLVSYFELKDSLAKCPNIAVKIKNYKEAVRDYKEGIFTNKMQVDKAIKELRESFRNFLFYRKFDREISAFRKKCGEYSLKYGDYLAKDDKNLTPFVAQMFGIFDFDKEQAKHDFDNLKRCYNDIFNLELHKPLEWRFEFPEVLDNNGDFMGFDLIVGNPPYGNLNKIEIKQYIESKYPNSYFGEISSNFAELAHNLIKQKAHFSFVTSYALLFSLAQSGLRNLLHSNYKNIRISSYDRDGSPQFDKISQSVCI